MAIVLCQNGIGGSTILGLGSCDIHRKRNTSDHRRDKIAIVLHENFGLRRERFIVSRGTFGVDIEIETAIVLELSDWDGSIRVSSRR